MSKDKSHIWDTEKAGLGMKRRAAALHALWEEWHRELAKSFDRGEISLDEARELLGQIRGTGQVSRTHAYRLINEARPKVQARRKG